ncbi:cysteine desulfurase NifS [Candidatus Pacearchaeota archaeon]|nr:cysteine desulfurase NifS [Candidatus Pacearchaeota archaeon]
MTQQKKIYLDHAATTPVAPEVLQAMQPYFSEKFGNAGSLHSFGREARESLEDSRKKVAKMINARPNEIIFTSGGTESNNLAIKGIAYANKNLGNHIITTKIEHPAIEEPCLWLEKNGFNITFLNVDKDGLINLRELEQAITEKTILVSIMFANNEIGTIQPIEEIGKICKKQKHKVYFHTDAVQGLGKEKIDIKKMNIDLLSASGHKIYGPKGIGLLYINQDVKIEGIQHGGGHEFHLRSGTENVPGIVGFSKALYLMDKDMEKENKRLKELRDNVIKRILEEIPKSHLNGHPTKRLANNIHFYFEGVEGEALLIRLDGKGIAVSTGSACSSHSLKPSHVLTAIGLKPELAHGSLRITMGKSTTKEDMNFVVDELKKIVQSLRKISPFGKW